MKKLLSLALMAVALSVASSSHAQGGYTAYAAQTLLAGGTNNVAAATTNSYTHLMTVTRQREVAVQISFNATGTNTSDIVFVIDPSVDGTTFDTANNDHNFTLTANGTNTVTAVTNLVAPGAIGYLRLSAVENPNGGTAITNLTFKYAIKR